jgi:hypothetical protein
VKLLKSGTIKRIHVNKKVIASNLKHGKNDPPISIQHHRGPDTAHVVKILGECVMRSDKPLKCGARVYVETVSAVCFE